MKKPNPELPSRFVLWGSIILGPAVLLLIILQIRYLLTDGSDEMVTLAKSRIRTPGIVYAITWIVILSIMVVGAVVSIVIRFTRKKKDRDE